MNTLLAQKLCEITNAFYRDNAASFSATRTSPWNGWKASMAPLENKGLLEAKSLNVLDFASGNSRFASFLASEYPERDITVYAVDNCEELVVASPHVHFQNFDIVAQLLLNPAQLSNSLDAPLCDASVCFGFMHHIPGQDNRALILETLLNHTKSGGLIIVSFWMFMNNEALAKKAALTHAQALSSLNFSDVEITELDEGDFFLGWKDTVNSYRYCHNFTDAEIDELIAGVDERASVVARFNADGRTNNLNAYIILQKCSQ